MAAFLALLGGYAYHAISTTGAVVKYTYDRPLMAINYTRAAGQTFSQMETELIRGADPSTLANHLKVFRSDLAVANLMNSLDSGEFKQCHLRKVPSA